MMLLPNDIIEFVQPPIRIRVLWIDPKQSISFVIDIDANDAMPYQVEISQLLDDLRTESRRLVLNDPYARHIDEERLPQPQKSRRERAWSLIAELVKDEPRIFHSRYRAKQIKILVSKSSVSSVTLYAYIRRYWQRGMVPNALIPDYANSGAPGKTRKAGTAKRGRPRQFGGNPGGNVDEEIRRIFLISVERFYKTSRKFTKRATYDQMVADFFMTKTVDPKTLKIKHRKKPDATLPTFDQFLYWMEKECDLIVIKRRRVGRRIYEKDMRGLVGSATSRAWGPGARFEIDATIADVYLLSRLDRTRIIGRPVIYLVIDVFSRMIVGIYVGLEGPSWVGAMMALANTVSDKVAYCRRFGITIEPEEWPCHFMPSVILADRGELEGSVVESLAGQFHVTIENPEAYRADWKGIIEQRFRLLPAKFKAYVPGYIDVDYRERGGSDYRLDATLDLDQFTEILINCVLYYNNKHELTGYDRDQDVAASGIRTVPLDLWEWGIENRSGSLRRFREEDVRFCLLPRHSASVTTRGIQFRGAYYSCDLAMEEHWFDRARQNGRWKVTVCYDPRDMDVIFLQRNDRSNPFVCCYLTEYSRQARDLSLWEIEQNQNTRKHQQANNRNRDQAARADLSATIEQIVEKAAAQRPDVKDLSNAERTGAIRTNRAVEKAHNRHHETFRFDTPKNSSSSKAPVLPFATPNHEDNIGDLDITEILGGHDDDH